ncbi:hypothetical protein HPB51_003594 [Rhipicephalus microplus]|uniref:Uncharacterized protein n=1 Tax=Rhipicephalus microplus TaxID=6941 RepID=A0A9J6DZH7_RHIMP|nr:hypothetical protein HPB51_003594 [Rhipicephalus microplus]
MFASLLHAAFASSSSCFCTRGLGGRARRHGLAMVVVHEVELLDEHPVARPPYLAHLQGGGAIPQHLHHSHPNRHLHGGFSAQPPQQLKLGPPGGSSSLPRHHGQPPSAPYHDPTTEEDDDEDEEDDLPEYAEAGPPTGEEQRLRAQSWHRFSIRAVTSSSFRYVRCLKTGVEREDITLCAGHQLLISMIATAHC